MSMPKSMPMPMSMSMSMSMVRSVLVPLLPRRYRQHIVRALYKRSFIKRMRAATTIDYSEIGWADDDVRVFARVVSGGWLKDCRRLLLAYNQIEDDGMELLARALRHGKATHLESIDIRGNPASAAAKQGVRDAIDSLIAQGVMACSEIKIFGTPDEAAKILQRRIRSKWPALGMAAFF